jgi:hypothetical protein
MKSGEMYWLLAWLNRIFPPEVLYVIIVMLTVAIVMELAFQ